MNPEDVNQLIREAEFCKRSTDFQHHWRPARLMDINDGDDDAPDWIVCAACKVAMFRGQDASVGGEQLSPVPETTESLARWVNGAWEVVRA